MKYVLQESKESSSRDNVVIVEICRRNIRHRLWAFLRFHRNALPHHKARSEQVQRTYSQQDHPHAFSFSQNSAMLHVLIIIEPSRVDEYLTHRWPFYNQVSAEPECTLSVRRETGEPDRSLGEGRFSFEKLERNVSLIHAPIGANYLYLKATERAWTKPRKKLSESKVLEELI